LIVLCLLSEVVSHVVDLVLTRVGLVGACLFRVLAGTDSAVHSDGSQLLIAVVLAKDHS